MNIFYLDKNPQKCAEYHCDKHVVKMVLETAQLLCSVYYHQHLVKGQIPYKLTHDNHPCAVRVRSSKGNYDRTMRLFKYLLIEYTKRYKKRHRCSMVYNRLMSQKPVFKNTDFTQPPECMPEECKTEYGVVESYRKYYNVEKSAFAKRNYTEKPIWYNNSLSKTKKKG